MKKLENIEENKGMNKMEEEFISTKIENGGQKIDPSQSLEIEGNKNQKFSFFEIKKKLILKEFINILKNID